MGNNRRSSVISIANLETPLTNSKYSIRKTGVNFKSDIHSIKMIKDIGFNLVCLANNHIMDFGSEGLFETMETLKKRDITYIGAGENLEEAKNPQIVLIEGKRIAFINACESEFSISDVNTPGANPFDLIQLIEQYNSLKEITDYIFLIYHGGAEYYSLPTPNQRRMMRFLVDIGFDGIISHHTHVFGAFEFYKGKPIFYSLGNFLMFSSKYNQHSAILKLFINDDKIDYELVPIILDMKSNILREMNTREKSDFFQKIEKNNTALMDVDIFLRKWEEFIQSKKKYYSHILSRFPNRLLRKLKKIDIIPLPSYSSTRAIQLLNIIRCETHNEILRNILENENREK